MRFAVQSSPEGAAPGPGGGSCQQPLQQRRQQPMQHQQQLGSQSIRRPSALRPAFGLPLRPSLLLPLLLLLLLLPQPGLSLDLSSGLIEEAGALMADACMSTQQLADAVSLAAWTVPGRNKPDGSPLKAVMITTCNIVCLKELFEPFMWAVENNKDGDFSENIIIVGNGISAYLYCDSLRHKHKHKCVLDRMCAPPNAGNLSSLTMDVTFGTPLYFLSLLQKVTWALEVLKLGVAVHWTDMDITYFHNPLHFMYQAAPESDLVVQTEYWDGGNVFVGDVCKFEGPDAGCIPGTKEHPSVHKPGVCCGMAINGGQWLFNPTPAGLTLLASWRAHLFEDGVVMRNVWKASAQLDQGVLGWLIFHSKAVNSGEYQKVLNARLYHWDKAAMQYVNHANITRQPLEERIYRTSAFRTQSHCFGDCGWMGDNIGYQSFNRGDQLVCVMPRLYYERLISFHQNCYSDIKAKRSHMMAFKNWTYDEERYISNKQTSGKGVFPEW